MSSDRNRVLPGKVAGLSFESFLEEAGIAEEMYTVAMERVTAWQTKERVQTLSKEEETQR